MPLLEHDFHLVAHVFPAVLRETAVFWEACVLPGLCRHQHLCQAAAGELPGIFAYHTENGLLHRGELDQGQTPSTLADMRLERCLTG